MSLAALVGMLVVGAGAGALSCWLIVRRRAATAVRHLEAESRVAEASIRDEEHARSDDEAWAEFSDHFPSSR